MVEDSFFSFCAIGHRSVEKYQKIRGYYKIFDQIFGEDRFAEAYSLTPILASIILASPSILARYLSRPKSILLCK